MFRFIAQSSIWFWCALMLWKRHVEQQQQQRQQQQRRQQQQQQQQQKSKVVLDLVNNKSASCHAQVPPTPTTPPAPTWINAWRAGASLLNSKTIGLDIPNNVEVHSVRLESGKAWAIYDRTNVVDEQQKRTSWCMSYLSSRNHKTLSDNDITSAASHDKSSLMDTWLARHVAHAKQSPGLFQYGNTMAQIYSAYDKAEIPPAWANLLPPVFR